MNRLTVFIITMAIAMSTLVLHQTGRLSPIEDGATTMFMLIQQPFIGIARGVGDLAEMFGKFGNLRDENARLREQVASLEREVALLQAKAQEVDQLRERLNLATSSPELMLLSADIVGWDTNNLRQTLTLNRGSDDGIEEGMSVVTTRGLVGRVEKVSTRSAKVLLVIDANSAVRGVVLNEQQQQQGIVSNATGIVQGQGLIANQPGNTLIMRFIPQTEPIKINDLVFTSGIGANYPKGIMIGRIVSLKRNDVDTTQEAQVEPSVDFGRLDHVFVILNFRPTKLD